MIKSMWFFLDCMYVEGNLRNHRTYIFKSLLALESYIIPNRHRLLIIRVLRGRSRTRKLEFYK